MVTLQCQVCGADFKVLPARENRAKYCSYACSGKGRRAGLTGPRNFNWREGIREKNCQQCGRLFPIRHREPLCSFEKRKFCSKECIRTGQTRHYGEAHPRWKADSRRKTKRGSHGRWADAVLRRDGGKCQHCGSTEGLHAHHVKSFADHPELRFDVSNGLTLCFRCHWKVHHPASTANGVNSGNTPPALAGVEGNPEPSLGRKPLEGVTTRGRAYRRWVGECDWCGTFISKPWSDVKGKAHLFCSKRCSGLHRAKHIPMPWATAVISSTSAPPERDDIV